jgi:hypothetical protein
VCRSLAELKLETSENKSLEENFYAKLLSQVGSKWHYGYFKGNNNELLARSQANKLKQQIRRSIDLIINANFLFVDKFSCNSRS